jgi:hypothetical protein
MQDKSEPDFSSRFLWEPGRVPSADGQHDQPATTSTARVVTRDPPSLALGRFGSAARRYAADYAAAVPRWLADAAPAEPVCYLVLIYADPDAPVPLLQLETVAQRQERVAWMRTKLWFEPRLHFYWPGGSDRPLLEPPSLADGNRWIRRAIDLTDLVASQHRARRELGRAVLLDVARRLQNTEIPGIDRSPDFLVYASDLHADDTIENVRACAPGDLLELFDRRGWLTT